MCVWFQGSWPIYRNNMNIFGAFLAVCAMCMFGMCLDFTGNILMIAMKIMSFLCCCYSHSSSHLNARKKIWEKIETGAKIEEAHIYICFLVDNRHRTMAKQIEMPSNECDEVGETETVRQCIEPKKTNVKWATITCVVHCAYIKRLNEDGNS